MPKPTRHYSKRQETRIASEIGAKTTPNSGATSFSKGDLIFDDVLIECKTLTKEQKTHTIKKEWLEGIRSEQLSMGKRIPALMFDFGTQRVQDQYVILRLQDFKMLMEIYNSMEE